MEQGDLLALLDAAPGGLASLAGRLRTWTDLGRRTRGIEELMSVRVVTLSVGTSGAPGPTEATDMHRVWFAAPDRWRVEGDNGVLMLSDGEQRWEGVTAFVTGRGPARGLVDAGALGDLLAPGALLGTHRCAVAGEIELLGRRCLDVTAEPRAPDRLRPGGPPLPVCPARVAVDAEHGIVLRRVDLVDGAPAQVTEFVELAVGGPVDDATFAPGAGTTVQTAAQEAARIAAARSTMAVGPPTSAARAEQYVPWGRPPDDPEAAEAAITAAFARASETDPDGRDLVNVQAGEGLGASQAAAARRYPGAEQAEWLVEIIRFVCPDEAVVWFTIELGGRVPSPIVSGRRGRAVRVDGRWLIERGTMAEVLGLAGVTLPPPGD
jgi:hypothetical protein